MYSDMVEQKNSSLLQTKGGNLIFKGLYKNPNQESGIKPPVFSDFYFSQSENRDDTESCHFSMKANLATALDVICGVWGGGVT